MQEGDFFASGSAMNRRKIDRRDFLKMAVLAAAAGFSPVPVFGAVHRLSSPAQTISLYNTHTGETLDAAYCVRGRYCQDVLNEVNHILRDHRTGEVAPIDPGVLDFLHAISRKLGSPDPFHIISGYRSPATNDLLRQRSGHVARNSLHMEGKAIDIRLPGVSLPALRRAALDLKRGGVGYYPGPNFVHVDVGRVRVW